MGTTTEPRMIDATTQNLIVDLAKVQIEIKVEGIQLRTLQASVGANKKRRDKIITELTKRAIDENQLKLPMGYTVDTLFAQEDGGEEE